MINDRFKLKKEIHRLLKIDCITICDTFKFDKRNKNGQFQCAQFNINNGRLEATNSLYIIILNLVHAIDDIQNE